MVKRLLQTKYRLIMRTWFQGFILFLSTFAGLARKEDFPYITYYCPHCNALNGPKQPSEHISGSSSPTITALAPVDDAEVTVGADDLNPDTISSSTSDVAAAAAVIASAVTAEIPES